MTLFLVSVERKTVSQYVVNTTDEAQAEIIATNDHIDAKAQISHTLRATSSRVVRLRPEE